MGGKKGLAGFWYGGAPNVGAGNREGLIALNFHGGAYLAGSASEKVREFSTIIRSTKPIFF